MTGEVGSEVSLCSRLPPGLQNRTEGWDWVARGGRTTAPAVRRTGFGSAEWARGLAWVPRRLPALGPGGRGALRSGARRAGGPAPSAGRLSLGRVSWRRSSSCSTRKEALPAAGQELCKHWANTLGSSKLGLGLFRPGTDWWLTAHWQNWAWKNIHFQVLLGSKI